MTNQSAPIVTHKNKLHFTTWTNINELHVGDTIIKTTDGTPARGSNGLVTTTIKEMSPHPGEYSYCQHINVSDCYDERIPVLVLRSPVQ